jgi:fermentation-respiration switch protein FrsA (DUF1100 family)
MHQAGYPLASLGARVIVAAASVRTRSRLVDPVRWVGRIAPRALLVIAPKDDALISWRQSVRLYEAAGDPKELYVVEGARHAEALAVDPEGYRSRVLDFLERHLVLGAGTGPSVHGGTASRTYNPDRPTTA